MPNYVSNKLTITGLDADRVLKATTARYREDNLSYYLDPSGSVVAYFSNEIQVSAHRRKQQTRIFPDKQKVLIQDRRVEVFFESAWSTPIWEVQEVSRQFPTLAFRLRGWDISAAYGWLFSIAAGVITELDMRENWNPEQKALAAKYRIKVTSDRLYGGEKTAGTILFEGIERYWTWSGHEGDTCCSVFIKDGNTVIHESTWPEGASRAEEVYEAVVNELQAGPAPTPRDGNDDSDDDDDPQPGKYVVVKAYSTGAGR